MPRARAVLMAAAAALAISLAHAAPAGPGPADISVKALVAAASTYVARYQQEFAFLLADEAYSQTRTDAAGRVQSRQLRSEFFLTFLPADHEWVAVRDVVEVDGTPVPGREDLRTLLSRREELRGLINQVIARNARYNIGLVTRNFNEPTLPLLLLGAKRINDVKFERRAIVREGAVTLATLAFAEHGRPTLVRSPDGPLPGRGEFVIESGTGVVRHTTFELDKKGVTVRLTTTYALDSKIGLWLPAVFTERYESTSPSREVVVCEATYSNYRRFEVTAKIK